MTFSPRPKRCSRALRRAACRSALRRAVAETAACARDARAVASASWRFAVPGRSICSVRMGNGMRMPWRCASYQTFVRMPSHDVVEARLVLEPELDLVDRSRIRRSPSGRPSAAASRARPAHFAPPRAPCTSLMKFGGTL